jgi:biopolymer transport protein ExbD
LPLLKAKLKETAKTKGVREKDLKISISVDPNTTQQRVIDVLNLLAQLEIKSVTFRDLESD